MLTSAHINYVTSAVLEKHPKYAAQSADAEDEVVGT
jgi:hypothetical protein